MPSSRGAASSRACRFRSRGRAGWSPRGRRASEASETPGSPSVTSSIRHPPVAARRSVHRVLSHRSPNRIPRKTRASDPSSRAEDQAISPDAGRGGEREAAKVRLNERPQGLALPCRQLAPDLRSEAALEDSVDVEGFGEDPLLASQGCGGRPAGHLGGLFEVEGGKLSFERPGCEPGQTAATSSDRMIG